GIRAFPPANPPRTSSTAAEMKVTEAEMKAAKLDIAFRDYCAHLLIPLNKCRQENFYLPFRCVDERHEYEYCQYIEYVPQGMTGNGGNTSYCAQRLQAFAPGQDEA